MLRCSIVVLALAGLCLSPAAVAQEGSRSVGQSLSERFSALRNVFKRNNTPTSRQAESNNSRRPQPPMPYDPADLQRQQQATQPVKPQVVPQKAVAKVPTRSTVRRSPVASSREEELDEALADLLAPTPRQNGAAPADRPAPDSQSNEVPEYLQGLVEEDEAAQELFDATAPADDEIGESEPTAAEPVPVASASQERAIPGRNPFDLHQALASQAALASSRKVEPPAAEKTQPVQQPEAPVAETEATVATQEAINVAAPVVSAGTNNLRRSQPATETVVETTPQPAAAAQWQGTVAADAYEATVEVEPAPAAKEAFAQAVERSLAPGTAPAAAASEQVAESGRFLTSYVQPLIQSHVEGPRQVVVGRSSSFVVRLRNSGQTAAEKLTATVAIPAWADVVDATPSTGVVQHAATAEGAHSLQWRLSQLDVSDEQTLTLKLIPRSGQPLQLAVQWTHAPVAATATVEVREPKLNIAITGPGDVLYGKPQRYKLLLTNPGTGLAEGVSIRLTPPGGGQADVIEHPVGDLPAGAKHDIELELVAREAGELTVEASAVALGGLEAATVKHVTCRKPELQLDWRGPDKKYAGTVATYYFRVRNPGAAATEDLVVDVRLPAGAELLAASEGHVQPQTDLIRWKGMPLTPGEQRFMQLRCKLNRPGANQLTATAKSETIDLVDTKTFATNVVALADLKLEVADPKGPVAVGEEALYTVRVVNRGTTAASNVNVVAMFSAGIDPTAVEGAEHAVEDGRVAFRPITSLPAGQHVELKIRAQAGEPGTHIFRTEVVCADLDTKLAAEETTRFFIDEQRWDDPARAYSTAAKATDTTTR